jgi:phenylacetate-coenzyme A ligase PaaK-like adenylate-forming protein
LTQPVVPESFRARPYARQHYSVIARWAAKYHPFYMPRVHGEKPDFGVLTRADVQDGNDTLLNGFPISGRTSGSTAMPVLVSWSKERSELDTRDTAQYVRWLGGPLPNMRIVSLIAHAANERTIDVIEPIPAQVEFILRRQRDASACSLVTYPSNLEHLCRYVIDNRIDMAFMRRVVCLSEVYEPWHDELVRQAFPNAVATCTYSSVELGLIAARCPHRPENYHIMAHKLGVEFLDEDGRPCRDGEAGQVVVTDYWNRRTTMIRYALGDLAAPTTCGCGKIMAPAMTNVIGKVRGVLKDATGRPIVFTGLSPMFRDSPEIRQFQVVQPALGHFVIRYVPRGQASLDPFFERVRTRFGKEFGASVLVEFEQHEEIARSAGGKFHGSICLA